MRCKYCDSENKPKRNICEFCGAPLEYVEEAEKQIEDVSSDFPEEAPYKVPDYLVHAVLVTVFCCMPVGIVAIFFAARAKTLSSRGEYVRAMEASEMAKASCWIGFGITAVISFFFLIGSIL